MKSNSTQSIYRALSILNTFTDNTPFQKEKDIVQKTGLSQSTVSRHLNTMLDMGFIERDNYTGLYHLGIQIVVLYGVYAHSSDLYRLAYPQLQQLSFDTKLHTFLGVPKGNQIVHMASVGAESSSELFTPTGYAHPMYACAMGRAVMAYMDNESISKLLDKEKLEQYTLETITDAKKLRQELKKVAFQGYCLLKEELTIGKSSLAAPVYDKTRKIIGAISVSGNTIDMDLDKTEKELAHKVMSVAGKISGKLGYFPR